MTTFIAVGFVVVFVTYAVALYNRLVAYRNRVQEAWSDIDVQMKRRYDLIPNVVETVKGYAAHEQDTLERVIAARDSAAAATRDAARKARAEGALQSALTGVLALAESYPELKANQNFLALQHQLAEIEDQIQHARRYYNGSARDMNNLIEQFPSNLVARRFAFDKTPYFELEAAQGAAREPVAVKF